VLIKKEDMVADEPRKPWVAGLLTLVTRGLGHVYAGKPKRGLVLFAIEQCLLIVFGITSLAYTPDIFLLLLAVVVGTGFTIFCIVDAVKVAKANQQHYVLAKYNRWFFYVGYFVVLSLGVSTIVSEGVKANLVQAYKLPSGSMEPTLLSGDHVVVDRRAKAKSPQKGQIIIFEYPEDPTKDFIKRVVAVGGDTVEVKDKQLFVNGKAMKEDYIEHKEVDTIPASQNPRDNFGPKVIPANSYFVMGDNRDRTYDSRFWGAVSKDKVKGTVKSIYWSWDREKFAVRWDRIGMHIQ
jgi:signal peptidase I